MDLIEHGVALILEGMGIDRRDRNFIDTPERYARFLAEMFEKPEVEYATFPEEYSDFIMFKGHEMWSLCPHHLLPVQFRVSVAYVPNGEVLGLSKLARVLDETNNKPLLQEAFTKEVITRLYDNVPGILGAGCYVDGQHGCTRIRGVHSDGRFVTYRTVGVMQDPDNQRRFIDLCLHQT